MTTQQRIIKLFYKQCELWHPCWPQGVPLHYDIMCILTINCALIAQYTHLQHSDRQIKDGKRSRHCRISWVYIVSNIEEDYLSNKIHADQNPCSCCMWHCNTETWTVCPMWTALGLIIDTVGKKWQTCEKNLSIHPAAFYVGDYATIKAASWALIPEPSSMWQDILFIE